MKRAIPIIVAVLLILAIGGVTAANVLWDKYSYSKEEADWKEFYKVSDGECAIILQDEMVEEKAIVQDGTCYVELATVHKYLNEIFYADMEEQLLLYTTAADMIKTDFGAREYTIGEETKSTDYVTCFVREDVLYVALEYVKLFTNYSYEQFDLHLQMYTEWGSRQVAEIAKDTAVRVLGGVKSPILKALAQGEQVEILDEMETWSKVKTTDSVIGYVENKRLTNRSTQQETPVTDYAAEEYTTIALDGKVSLGWHSIGGVGGNVTLGEMVSGTKGMNVIAPTWFSMCDDEGGMRSFGELSYVKRAHELGLQVWGVLDNFNYSKETGTTIDVYGVLSSTVKRQRLVENVTKAALELGLDGINLDFEGLSSECGVHYVQFLRELSIQCRSNGLVFSIDNYVPFHFNDFYRLDIQGEIADYVIIMGYDEHWRGSGDPGSVASIDYVTGGIERTLEEVPASKVVNALPFYTILWKIDGAKVTDEFLIMRNTDDFLRKVGATPTWDETTSQNYAEWKSGSVTYKIWLEDAKSISAKLNVMKAHDIGGVAAWRLGYETPVVWELLNAYANS